MKIDEKIKKIKYNTLGIFCVNSKWPVKWLGNNENCECNFDCKMKIFEIESGYEYVITEKEYKKLRINKQINKL